MAYSSEMKKAVGLAGACLDSVGLGRQSDRFGRHGRHLPAPDAPLVLVACSGGRDSLALASVAAIVCGMRGIRCGAVLVDHGLFEGSDRVAARAADQCRNLGLDPVVTRRVEVARTGAGLESDARDARYRVLTEVARASGAQALLLAHTRDDQAETVLIGLIRSQGLEAITGMEPVSARCGVRLLRPILGLSRQETTRICRQQGLQWWDDPTNGDDRDRDSPLPPDYPLRSRIRHDLLPALTSFAGRDMAARLAAGSALARRDEDYLRIQSEALRESSSRSPSPEESRQGVLAVLDAARLSQGHPALRMRVIAEQLNRFGLEAKASRVAAVDALVSDWHGQGAVDFPSRHSVIRKGQVILICNDGDHANR
ncbi:tRNA lysidine(34) synthetase TilS [Bifidobacterium favimelis]|uniref:tRNA(Ile)-lysidine synthase n=1 Tax=Bifidobacterium favimelis TaxID=3122979 RepID=A0ABU8ZM14_9BIFI